MVTVTSWRIVIEKGGLPVIYQWNDRYFHDQKMNPESEDIIVTEDGIEYEHTARGGKVTHYKYPYSNLSYSEAPSPLSFRESVGGVKVQRNILSFVYELASGVLFSDDCYSFVKDRKPLDIAALLAEYEEFSSQLGGVDWEKAASHIKLKKKA